MHVMRTRGRGYVSIKRKKNTLVDSFVLTSRTCPFGFNKAIVEGVKAAVKGDDQQGRRQTTTQDRSKLDDIVDNNNFTVALGHGD